MLMPIVSMNKMAMNESVAATCCYHEIASPTNVYWEVLHGGWIGSGYVSVADYLHRSYKAWTAFGYDLASFNPAKDGGLPALASAKGADDRTTWYVQTDPSESFDDFIQNGGYTGSGDAWIPLQDWFDTNSFGAYPGSACTHKDSTCLYRYEEIQHLNNQHFEATSGHRTAGDNWNKPHNASGFNS